MKRTITLITILLFTVILSAQENLFEKTRTANYSVKENNQLKNLTSRREIKQSEVLTFKNNIKFRTGSKGILNIFDKKIEFEIGSNYGKDINGITGYSLNSKSGWGVISVSDKSFQAHIHTPDNIYKIENVDNNLYFVSKIDRAAIFKPEKTEYSETLKQGNTVVYPEIKPEALRSPATIKVLVAYTSEVYNWAGGTKKAIDDFINSCFNFARLAYEKTGIVTKLELAHSYQVSFNETGLCFPTLDSFKWTNDGIMDEVHNLRIQYQADVCLLLLNRADYGGVAATKENNPASYEQAFAVVDARRAAEGYSFAHEIGHFLGCQHYETETKYPGITDAHGHFGEWTFSGVKKYYSTVMTLVTEGKYTRIPYFSTPFKCDEEGNLLGILGERNNGRIMNEMASYIAAFEPQYRAKISGPSIIPRTSSATFTCNASGGTPPYRYEWWIYKIGTVLDPSLRADPNQWRSIPGATSATWVKAAPNNGDYRDFDLKCVITDAANNDLTSNIISSGYYSRSLAKENGIEEKVIAVIEPEFYKTELLDCYPNPSNPETTIRFNIQEAGEVILKIYDITGREVKTLVDERKEPGRYSVTFDGSQCSSGMYIYTLKTKDYFKSKKFQLIK